MEKLESRCPEEELVESFRLDSLSSRTDPDFFLCWEESLVQLIDWTRTSVGQEKLAEGNTVPVFLSLLNRVHTSCLVSQSADCSLPLSPRLIRILPLFLKLLRNLCVSDLNRQAFLAEKGPRVLVQIATAILSVFKAVHDSDHFEDPTKVQISSESNTSKDASATFPPKNPYDYSKLRADLEAVGRTSCADVNASTSKLALYAGSIPVSASIECLRMLLQLLGNFSRGGDACQVAVWRGFFPTLFSELASLRSSPISDVLCMILCTCCQGSKERSWQLCQGHGVGLMSLLILSAVANEEIRAEKGIDWFEALWRHLCLKENLFPLLFTNLGIIPMRQELEFSKLHTEEYCCACQIWLRTGTFTVMQVNLLSFLVESLTHDLISAPHLIDDEKAGLKCFMSKDNLCFMVKILERAVYCAREELDAQSADPPVNLTSAVSPTIQILGYLLLLWRAIGTCDPKMKQRELLNEVLLQHGFLDLLLKMLEALGPPEAPGRKPNVQDHEERRFSGPLDVPSTDSYVGYRRDVVAVIANVAYQNRLVQDHVRETGKLLLVLQQCIVDQHNPFLREWGLWAIRNLLEGNDLNQKEIASLEMKEPLSVPDLTNMGLRFEVDPGTGAPRLVNNGSEK